MAFFILTRFVLVKYSCAFVERPSQGTSSLASRPTTVSLDPIGGKATSTEPCVSRTQPILKYLGIMLILIAKNTCLVMCNVCNVYTNKRHYSLELYYTSFKLINISIA